MNVNAEETSRYFKASQRDASLALLFSLCLHAGYAGKASLHTRNINRDLSSLWDACNTPTHMCHFIKGNLIFSWNSHYFGCLKVNVENFCLGT